MTFHFEKERMTALSADGQPMGFIAFPRVRPGLVNISQITVFPAFRGQNVENDMMKELLSYLEKQNQKAVLLCQFAQQYVEKNPRWKKILPGDIHFTKY